MFCCALYRISSRIVLGVEHRARAAVDEHELRRQDEALAFHVGAHRDHAPAAERVVPSRLAYEAGR